MLSAYAVAFRLETLAWAVNWMERFRRNWQKINVNHSIMISSGMTYLKPNWMEPSLTNRQVKTLE